MINDGLFGAYITLFNTKNIDIAPDSTYFRDINAE